MKSTEYAYNHRNRLIAVKDFGVSVASTAKQPVDWGRACGLWCDD
jgi:hypothetical protein